MERKRKERRFGYIRTQQKILPYAAKFTYGRNFIYIRTQILLHTHAATVNIFEEKKGQKRREKGYAIPKQWNGGCQGFLDKKYYLKRSESVEIFFQKPAGLDLYCR